MIGVSQAPFKKYTGDNTLAVYAIDFPRFNNDEVKVYVISPAGVETLLTISTDYTLSDILPSSGDASLTLVNGGQDWINSVTGFLDTDYVLIIEYNPEARQEVSFTTAQKTIIPSLFGKVLDQMTMSLKAVNRIASRTLQLPRVDTEAGVSPELPSIDGNGGKIIAAKTDATGYEFGPTTQSIFDAQTAAETAQAAAETAQTGAETAETNAAASATAANTSASNAAASASAASTSETNAANSETAAEAAKDAAIASNALDEYDTYVEVSTIDSPINITDADNGKLYVVNSTGGDVTFNLPAISTLSDGFKIGILKYIDNNNSIIVVPDGSETIGGNSNASFNAIGVGIKPYELSASNWARSFFTAGYQPPSGGGAGGGGFVVVGTQSIGAGGTIALNALSPQQVLKVQSSGGPVSASTTPFGTSAPADGTIINLIGQSTTNNLTITENDIAYGCLLNGDYTLRLNSSLTLIYDGVAQRYREISRR